MSDIWIALLVVLWGLVLVLLFLVAGALRLLGLIQLRLGTEPGALITQTGLDRGKPAPDFEAPNATTGEVGRLGDLRGRPAFIGFLSPTCYSCEEFATHLTEVALTRSRDFQFIGVCRGDQQACRDFVKRTKLRIPVYVDATGSIEKAYEVAMTPFGFVLDDQLRVLIRGVATTWPQLEALLGQEGTPGSAVNIVEVEHRTSTEDRRPA